MRRPSRTTFVLVAALATVPRVSRAQGAADIAAARALGIEGFKLAAAGDCQDAVDKLARSEALHHAVSVLAKLGECQVTIGKLVDGVETLRRVTREDLGAGAPAAFVSARSEAEALLQTTVGRVAHVHLHVGGAPPTAVWVKLDGVPVPSASLDTDRPVDPGRHTVEAGAPGFVPYAGELSSKEGLTEPVTITLVEATPPPAVAEAPGPSSAPPIATPTPPRRSRAARSHAAAYVSGGVGVGALIVGGVAGGVAVGEKSTLSGTCQAGSCPPSAASTLSAGKTAGDVSTVGFIVGAGAVAAAVVLYFVPLGTAQNGTHADVFIGPGRLGISGRF